MIPKKFSGLSILLILALLVSSFALIIPAAPVQAAVSAVSITGVGSPSATQGYGRTGAPITIYFSVTAGAATVGDFEIDVLQAGTSNIVASNTITAAPLAIGPNPFNYTVTLAGVASGTYDLKVSARQPSGSGTWVPSTVSSNAIVVDNTLPAVTLTNPSGGQFISANADYIVFFTVTDAIPNVSNVTVSATYSTDGGTTYPNLAFAPTSVAKGSGSATWLVAQMPSSDTSSARLQLTVTDAAGNSTVVTSSSNFTIIRSLPTVTILQPTSSSSWNGASSQTIQFNTNTGLSVSQDYKIEFSTDAGSTWVIVKDFSTSSPSSTPGLTNYTWTVNNTYRGSNAEIRVTPKDKAGNIGTPATSSAFTINDVTVPTVTVTAPLSGAKFYSGVTATGTTANPIWSWTSTDNVLSIGSTPQTLDYNVYLSTDGGSTYTLLQPYLSQPQGLNTVLTWTPPALLTPSTNCKIKITATDHATVPNISAGGISPTFSIFLPGTGPIASLTAPNGGQTWQAGTTQSITWTASDASDTTAKLTYTISLDTSGGGGGYPNNIATLTNQAQGTNTYSWSVPDLAGASNKIQIIANNPASGLSSTPSASAGNFSITSASFPVQTSTPVTLYPGWNLVSLPIVPTNSNIQNVLGSVIPDITAVWTANGDARTASNWVSWAPGAPAGLTTMVDGKSYWIQTNLPSGSVFFTFQGRLGNPPPSAPPSYATVAGWNMVGFTSTIAENVTPYLGTQNTASANYNLPVVGYDASIPAFTSSGSTDTLEPGLGYMVFYNTAGTVNASMH